MTIQTLGDTSIDKKNMPEGSVYTPETPNKDNTPMQGGPRSTDSQGVTSAPAAVYITPASFLPFVVQKGNAVTGSAGKTLQFTFANPTGKGNSIVVVMGMGEVEGASITLAVTDTQGNLYTEAIKALQSTTLEAAIFSTTGPAGVSGIPGGADIVTITIAGASSVNTAIAAEVYEVFGLIALTPGALDVTGTGNNAGSTTPATGSVTPLVPNEIAFAAIAAGGGTITPGTNWNLDSGSLAPTGGNLVSFGAESQILSTTAAQTATASLSASNAWAICIATFKGVILPVVAGGGSGGTVTQGSPPWRVNANSGDFADGAIATIGTKADAADITSTNTDTLMAFIKGIVKLLNTATGSAVPSNADYIALLADNVLPAAATIGNLVGALGDKFGRQVVLLNAFRDIVSPMTQLTLTSTTTETTLVSSVASTFLDLVAVIIINTSATATQVDFRDSTTGTIRASAYVPAGDMRGVALPVPLPQNTVNNNWTAKCGTSVASVIITGIYISNK